MASFTYRLDEIGMEDLAQVGGKNASLGEMMRMLTAAGLRIPGGFVVRADAYTRLIDQEDVRERITSLLSGLNKDDIADLSYRAREIRSIIKQAGIPKDIKEEIVGAYKAMAKEYRGEPDVAVRSSATAEDLPTASFAGQQESFLNIRGEHSLLEACLNCFASLFTDRAIAYRIDQGFDHLSVKLSIGVQKMVRSDLAASGVMFTICPESGFPDVVLVSSAYGLGENVVAGKVDPDEFIVFKPTLAQGFEPIIRRKVGAKQHRLIYSAHGSRTTTNVDVLPEEREVFSLSDREVLQLARWACIIEEHYSSKYGQSTPMDIEWAKDGIDHQLYIVQARPETVQARKQRQVLRTFQLKEPGVALCQGRAVGSAIARGVSRVIRSVHELHTFKDGEVLVTEMTDPDWEPVMKRAAAIVTNRGGRTCHAAIVSRELGIPCVVGTERATEILGTGRAVTVCCAEGETGTIYEGNLAYDTEEINLTSLPRTRTRILLNVGNPDQAFSLSSLPVDGVGLAREEFIIANDVRIHPCALTRLDEVFDWDAREEIMRLTRHYHPRDNYFIEKLSEGIATIAAAFYPREVLVRLSDFKTNEYANLLGGRQFEPDENNPMIGFRGAARYYSEKYKDGFALECRAIIRAREQMGLSNVKVMVPFCRSIKEAKAVIAELNKNGLVQGQNGLEIYVMCELPANVFSADLFAEIFDGFSIGSNDLTQLVLGLDRDSELVAPFFDERDEAVKRAIAHAIAEAKKAGRKIGICGQAPSDYPEMVKFLIEQGIDSISLNPDVAVKTLLMVGEIESELDDRQQLRRAKIVKAVIN